MAGHTLVVAGIRELVLAACGLATSVAVGIVLAVAEIQWQVAIYSYAIWWLLPIGAIGAGVVGSAGFFWGARWLGVRPGRLALAIVVGVSVAAFFVIHYVEFTWSGYGGSFWSYLDTAVQSASYESRVGATTVEAWSADRLGLLGYLVAGIQVVGFAIGGVVVLRWLRSVPYCGSCSAYLRRWQNFDRSIDQSRIFEEVSQRVEQFLENGDAASAVQEHRRLGAASFRNRLRNNFCSQLEVWKCHACSLSWARVTIRAGGSPPRKHVFSVWIRGEQPGT